MDASSASQGFIEPLEESGADRAQETGGGPVPGSPTGGSDYESIVSENASAFGSLTPSVLRHEYQDGRSAKSSQKTIHPSIHPASQQDKQAEQGRDDVRTDAVNRRPADGINPFAGGDTPCPMTTSSASERLCGTN